MKQFVKRSCGHEEKIKVYSGGSLKSEVIVGRESLKKCRACQKSTTPTKG